MSRFSLMTAALVLLTGASTAQAQSRFSLELRGGPAWPTADLGESALETGIGFGFNVGYRLQQHLGAYAGWDWHRFVTEEPFNGGDYDVEDTGYAFGLQFRHPLTDRFGGWVRASGIYNHIELEDDGGSIIADTGHELGWEAGGGLLFPVGQHFALTPGVRYRTFSATLDTGQGEVPVDLSYVTAEIGLTWSFGGRTLSAARSR
jgi:opacity protein-like surface antigen